MSVRVPPRREDEELIDQPGHSLEEVARALRDIQWVNRRLGGWSALRRAVEEMLAWLPAGRALQVLDLGTGSADLPRQLAAWGCRRGREIRVTAVDRSREVLAFAARERGVGVRLLRADLFQLPFPPASFDLVICSLFLHHFPPEAAVQLLRVMAHHTRHGIVVNDLERHRLAHWAIRVVCRLTRRGRLFRHDAPLSVLRAYVPGEVRDLLRAAGLGHLAVRRVFPFRLTVAGAVHPGHGAGARP